MDTKFLNELDKLKLRVQYAKIILLDFAEKPLKEIQGRISSGNLSINGSAVIRRTINLTMLASIENSGITNLENEISLNKKIKVEIGYKNPLKQYAEYGDIVWFPCGVFLVASATISRGTNGWNISISGKDKMVTLDGTCGGMLDASVTFSESYIYDDPIKRENWVSKNYVTIWDIIFESVHHYGGIDESKIIISDVPKVAKLLVKYVGDDPIYFTTDYSSFSYTEDNEHPHKVKKDENIGYKRTDFTYPGTLTLNAGESVVSLLNKIITVLGNFEFFFDLNGNFIFQEKKNYLNTASPLYELTIADYVKQYSNVKAAYSLTDLETVSSLAINPKYDNIKNDFIVWGERTDSNGGKHAIWYHLSIDKKPELNKALKYMWQYTDNEGNIKFYYTDTEIPNNILKGEIIRYPCTEWREELYRDALEANSEGRTASVYDKELLVNWNNLYTVYNEKMDWNPLVSSNPEVLDYWLDFIDTGSEMGKYSISSIGRRSKVVSDSKINFLYAKEVPDIIFLTTEQWNDESIKREYNTQNQKVFQLTEGCEDMFIASSTGGSAFDKIRELLYQFLNYNSQITIQATPRYYLEPNNILYIEDAKSNIIGNYVITQISLPLTYNGNMTITATEAVSRV